MVRLRLEQIYKDLIRDGGALDRKLHLVKWVVDCMNRRVARVLDIFLCSIGSSCKWTWCSMEKERPSGKKSSVGSLQWKNGDGVLWK